MTEIKIIQILNVAETSMNGWMVVLIISFMMQWEVYSGKINLMEKGFILANS